MTAKELNVFLTREKRMKEYRYGGDYCKKYARCLFCSLADEFPCASAHERLNVALQSGFTLSADLLPEPPLPRPKLSQKEEPARTPRPQTAAPTPRPQATVQEPQQGNEEVLETVAHILSDYNMNDMSEERKRELMKISAMLDSDGEDGDKKYIRRAERKDSGVPVLKLKMKSKE